MSESGGYNAFRQRLDAVLRRKDPDALRAFLVSEGQWDPDAATDVPAAMWMMIATSRDLANLHAEAREWLLTHGHAEEANAIFGARCRGKPTGGNPQGRPPQRPHQPHQPRQQHRPQQGRHPGRGGRPQSGGKGPRPGG